MTAQSRSSDPLPAGALAVGVDVGATLVKLAARYPTDGPLLLRLAPREAIERVAREVESARPAQVGLTGCGASALAARLSFDTARTDEFTAWRAGADLLRGAPRGDPADYLLVSLGTGTSALLVRGETVERVGGTALGGGTIAGLVLALVGIGDFDELVALAERGDRRRVDLLLSDLYDGEKSPLPGAMTAASFARLVRRPDPRPVPADLAQAIVGLVGENVGLICAGLARVAGVQEIVFGGSALRGNGTLAGLLQLICAGQGLRPVLLPNGEYAGAVGVMALAGGTPAAER